MAISKNALLLFCKPPVPGLVKTRLCKENNGPLSREQAADFFRASILDEADLAFYSFELLENENDTERAENPDAPVRTYELFVSTAPETDLHLIRSVFDDEGGWDRSITFLCDHGSCFDQHFNDAFDQIFARGYDNIVALGGDMPLLPPHEIVASFEWLDFLAAENDGVGMIIAPCQESGTSIVGRTCKTPVPAEGVFYNQSGRTVVAGYLEFLREHALPFAFLDAVSDVDTGADLAHLVTCLDAMADACEYQPGLYLPRRVLAWADSQLVRAVAIPDEEYDPRWHIDETA